MVAAEGLTIDTLFKAEVLSATALTIGLLLIALLKKDFFTSEKVRMNLKKNISTFYVTVLILIMPLMLFISWEILDFIVTGADKETAAMLELMIRNLRVISFALFNIGLLTSYYLMLKMKEAV